MKVIFLGTPEFAARVLEGIYDSAHDVVAVVTNVDKAKGRSGKKTPSPVKEYALKCGIPVYQYENISKEGEADLKVLNADVMVTAAYGQLLKENILNICPYGVINAHASLLPKYRGSSPIQSAIIAGESETGITVMKTELSMDTGDIILVRKLKIEPRDNSGTLSEKLSELAAAAIPEALTLIEKGIAEFTKQDETLATYCKKLSKEDGKINFNKSAPEIVDFIRGMTPKPAAYATYSGGRIKIIEAEAVKCNDVGATGEVIAAFKNDLLIKCGTDAVKVLRLQPDGGKVMKTLDFNNGGKIKAGERFL